MSASSNLSESLYFESPLEDPFSYLPEDLLVAATHYEHAVPYDPRENGYYLPNEFNGIDSNTHYNDDLLRARYGPWSFPTLTSTVACGPEFLNVVLAHLDIKYCLRLDKLYGYSANPTSFSVPSCEYGTYYPEFSAEGTHLAFDGDRFLTNMHGRWWRTSDDGCFVAVKAHVPEMDCFFVMTASLFVRLFVPWVRYGPLFFGAPTPHIVHSEVPHTSFKPMCTYMPVVEHSHIIGCADQRGPLPIIRGQNSSYVIPQARSNYVLYCIDEEGEVLYEAEYTNFRCSAVPPIGLDVTLPAEIIEKLLLTIVSVDPKDKKYAKEVLKAKHDAILPCGCSVYTSCFDYAHLLTEAVYAPFANFVSQNLEVVNNEGCDDLYPHTFFAGVAPYSGAERPCFPRKPTCLANEDDAYARIVALSYWLRKIGWEDYELEDFEYPWEETRIVTVRAVVLPNIYYHELDAQEKIGYIDPYSIPAVAVLEEGDDVIWRRVDNRSDTEKEQIPVGRPYPKFVNYGYGQTPEQYEFSSISGFKAIRTRVGETFSLNIEKPSNLVYPEFLSQYSI